MKSQRRLKLKRKPSVSTRDAKPKRDRTVILRDFGYAKPDSKYLEVLLDWKGERIPGTPFAVGYALDVSMQLHAGMAGVLEWRQYCHVDPTWRPVWVVHIDRRVVVGEARCVQEAVALVETLDEDAPSVRAVRPRPKRVVRVLKLKRRKVKRS